MNEYLKPIFEFLLTNLEENGIDYWVFGGISIAAYAGEFIRTNKDVDIFVKNADFENSKLILSDLCKQNNFELIYHPLKEVNERPKVEIKVDGEERFSMIPIYQDNAMVGFKYPDKYGGNEGYPNNILERVERNVSGYRFFTPGNEFIKDMFINHIKARPKKKKREEYQKDAKAILSPEELSVLDWVIE